MGSIFLLSNFLQVFLCIISKSELKAQKSCLEKTFFNSRSMPMGNSDDNDDANDNYDEDNNYDDDFSDIDWRSTRSKSMQSNDDDDDEFIYLHDTDIEGIDYDHDKNDYNDENDKD